MEPEKKETQATEEELATYEKLRKQVTKSLGELNEKLNTKTISQAMDKAIADLKGMGEHSKEAVTKAGET